MLVEIRPQPGMNWDIHPSHAKVTESSRHSVKLGDFEIPDEKGRHPRRVIEALSKRFADKPEGDLLKVLGFFDPDIAAIEKIIAEPVIENLTEYLCNKREATLLRAIGTLRSEELITRESKHQAERLIEETGYHRRELEELKSLV